MKKKILLFMPVIFTVFFGMNSNISPLYPGDHKMITDLDDNIIEVPVNPKKIACMHGVSFDRIVILGKGDNMVLGMKASPWAYKLYPELRNIQNVEPHTTGNVERMINLKVDLVLYSPNPAEAKKYRAAGIKTACGFSARKRPRTIDEYIANFKRQISFFGDLLGPEAKARADKYNEYFDKKIKKILSITLKIDKKDRPTVYYGGRIGGDMLSSQGKASVLHWDTEVAGGNFLPQALDNNYVEINMEQVVSWNPDIIFVSGWGNTLDIVKENPNWVSMRAAKNGNVYLTPKGVFMWENASGETPLFIIYMAKIFHPELFKDWDMIKEMKIFYSEIYNKTITDKDAERILQCLPPM